MKTTRKSVNSNNDFKFFEGRSSRKGIYVCSQCIIITHLGELCLIVYKNNGKYDITIFQKRLSIFRIFHEHDTLYHRGICTLYYFIYALYFWCFFVSGRRERETRKILYYMNSGREDRIINQMRSIANNCDMQVKSKKKSRNAPQIVLIKKCSSQQYYEIVLNFVLLSWQ